MPVVIARTEMSYIEPASCWMCETAAAAAAAADADVTDASAECLRSLRISSWCGTPMQSVTCN